MEKALATRTFLSITVISRASKHIIYQIKTDSQVGLGVLRPVKPLSAQC